MTVRTPSTSPRATSGTKIAERPPRERVRSSRSAVSVCACSHSSVTSATSNGRRVRRTSTIAEAESIPGASASAATRASSAGSPLTLVTRRTRSFSIRSTKQTSPTRGTGSCATAVTASSASSVRVSTPPASARKRCDSSIRLRSVASRSTTVNEGRPSTRCLRIEASAGKPLPPLSPPPIPHAPPPPRRRRENVRVLVVRRAEAPRQQLGQGTTEPLAGAVPEDLLRAPVEQRDAVRFVNGHDGVGRDRDEPGHARLGGEERLVRARVLREIEPHVSRLGDEHRGDHADKHEHDRAKQRLLVLPDPPRRDRAERSQRRQGHAEGESDLAARGQGHMPEN